MKFEELKIGQIFNLGNTPSYPKMKINGGYVDMRDEIVNKNPNQAVLTAEITLMNNSDLAIQFDESIFSIEEWINEIASKYI